LAFVSGGSAPALTFVLTFRPRGCLVVLIFKAARLDLRLNLQPANQSLIMLSRDPAFEFNLHSLQITEQTKRSENQPAIFRLFRLFRILSSCFLDHSFTGIDLKAAVEIIGWFPARLLYRI